MKISSKTFSIVTVSLVCLLILFFNTLFSQRSITIDFSKKAENKESIIGFLHVNDFNPLQANLQALKPKYWRVGNSLIDKNHRDKQFKILKEHNIIPILVLTDFYSHYDKRKYDWKKPYIEKDRLADLAEDLYKQYGNTVIYDIWNEPNHPAFWDGTRQEFFISFKSAYDRIRSMPGGSKAIITGPSTDGFVQDFIEEFLQFCQKNNMRIDILNWHINETQDAAFNIPKQVNLTKVWAKKYPNVKFSKVGIFEFIGPEYYFKPLTSLAYINFLDQTGIVGCKTCGEVDNENTCIDNSISGLLTSQAKPRSVWWVYKYYAESLPARLSTTVDSDRTAAISYYSKDSKSVKILFGNLGNNSNNIKLDLKSLKSFLPFSKSKKINYNLYKIQNTEQKALLLPLMVKNGSVTIENTKSTNIDLENIDNESVYLLELQTK